MYEMLSGDFPFRYFIERCKTNKFNLRTNSIKIVLYNWGRGICLDKEYLHGLDWKVKRSAKLSIMQISGEM
jgi:hypothetical protein